MADSYERMVARQLFLMTARQLGWPQHDNAWLYPDIFRWDRDEEGWLVIPALLAFYRNPLNPLTQEQMETIHNQIRQLIPGRLFFTYDGAIIWVERRPLEKRVTEGATTYYSWHPTHEELPRRWHRARVKGSPKAPSRPGRARPAMRILWKAIRKQVRI